MQVLKAVDYDITRSFVIYHRNGAW